MIENVRIYDFATRTFATIPAAELAPGMAYAYIENRGSAWVDANQVELNNEYFHPPFSKKTRRLVRKIQKAFEEVFPQTLEQWEDGFRKDHHPEREIAIRLSLAQKYRAFVNKHNLSRPERFECFRVMLTCTFSPREHVLEVVRLSAMTRDQALEAVETYYSTDDFEGDV